MTAPLLNIELARRIQLAEAQAAVAGAETMKRLRPNVGAAVESIAGGFAIYCGADSPTTQAVGIGLDGPVSEEEFDRLENFYRSRSEPVRVETCPLADASLIGHFGKRGYRVTEFSNVMALPLNGRQGLQKQSEPPRGLVIEQVDHGQIDLWTLTVSQGFAEKGSVIPEIVEVMKMFALSLGVECYLARVDGKVAGGGRWQFATGWRDCLEQARCLRFAEGECRRRCCTRGWRELRKRGVISQCAWRNREALRSGTSCGGDLRYCTRA